MYVKGFLERHSGKVDTSDLRFMDYKAILYTVPTLMTFAVTKSFTGKVGMATLFWTLNCGYWSVNYYYKQYNLNYQYFLLKNYHHFAPEI